MLHDFLEFLSNYHFTFCGVIFSAFPCNTMLHDPSTPNVKVIGWLNFFPYCYQYQGGLWIIISSFQFAFCRLIFLKRSTSRHIISRKLMLQLKQNGWARCRWISPWYSGVPPIVVNGCIFLHSINVLCVFFWLFVFSVLILQYYDIEQTRHQE